MRMSLQPPALLKIFLPFCKLRLRTALHGAEISATCQMQHKIVRFPLQRVTADTHTTHSSHLHVLEATEHVTRKQGYWYDHRTDDQLTKKYQPRRNLSTPPVLLLRFQVSWEVLLCCLISSFGVSKACSAFIFRIKQSNNHQNFIDLQSLTFQLSTNHRLSDASNPTRIFTCLLLSDPTTRYQPQCQRT